jgi:hypothetical protein
VRASARVESEGDEVRECESAECGRRTDLVVYVRSGGGSHRHSRDDQSHRLRHEGHDVGAHGQLVSDVAEWLQCSSLGEN